MQTVQIIHSDPDKQDCVSVASKPCIPTAYSNLPFIVWISEIALTADERHSEHLLQALPRQWLHLLAQNQ